jgi:hypothetical protein
VTLNLALVEDGRLQGAELMRRGNPEGGAFREVKFSALIEDEATFAGIHDSYAGAGGMVS